MIENVSGSGRRSRRSVVETSAETRAVSSGTALLLLIAEYRMRKPAARGRNGDEAEAIGRLAF
jgi:hypothetical protein